ITYTSVQEIRAITNTEALIDDLSFEPIEAKYVRMNGLTPIGKYGYSIYELEVYNNSEIKNVTDIGFNAEISELYIGETRDLETTITPEDATYKIPTYTSSDTSIVTIKNNKMIALQEGTVTITATADGKSTTMEIQVVNENAKKIADNLTTLSIVDGKIVLPQFEGYTLSIESSSIEKNY
ncbi:MAG: Ig-like domain-containing protein, partial [Coprobacillaceae bacterium]